MAQWGGGAPPHSFSPPSAPPQLKLVDITLTLPVADRWGVGTSSASHRLPHALLQDVTLSSVTPFRPLRIDRSEMRKNLRPIRGIIRRRLQAPDTDERLRDNEPARKYERQPTDAHQRA